MAEREAGHNWMWVVPASPLLLLIATIFGPSILNDLLSLSLKLSLLTGAVMLLAIGSVLFTGEVKISQPKVILSIGLACLDIVIPVGLVWLMVSAIGDLPFP